MMGHGIWGAITGVWLLVEWMLARVVNRPATAGFSTQLQLAMTRTDSSDLRLDTMLSAMGLGVVCLALGAFWPRIFSEIQPRLERWKRAHPKQFPIRRPSRRGRWFASRAIFLIAILPLMPMLAWIIGAASSPHIAALWPMPAKASLVMGASFLIGFQLTLYLGTGRRCSRCAYRMVSFRQSLERCPECGNPWKRLGGTVFGHRPPRAVLYVGCSLLIVAAAIWALVPIR